MTVAELSQSIQVFRRETVTNEYGETETVETLQFETYAKVVQMSEREQFQQGINTSTVVYKIIYRYLAERAIKKDDLIKWDNQTFTARGNSYPVMIKTKRWFKTTMALQGA